MRFAGESNRENVYKNVLMLKVKVYCVLTDR